MLAQLRSHIHRRKIIFADRLRFSRALRKVLFQWKLFSGNQGTDTTEKLSAIEQLCAAARLATSQDQIEKVEQKISSIDIDPDEVRPLLFEGDHTRIRKAAVLKPFNEETGEPGVVFISFEYEWAKLLGAENLEEFAKRYLLVVSPTWTPPHCTVNCLFPKIYPAPVYCLISNDTDMATFPRISENYRMIDLFASSWVQPDLFSPTPVAEKDIDILMLANFGVYKRHHVLFRAIQDLPEDWKIVLVGQPNGARTKEVLFSEADAFGVRDRFELRERITDDEVCDLLSRARMSLIFSKREGSCVAIVESMFADTPVGLVEGAQIGSARFINSSTGAFLNELNLAKDLIKLHKDAETMKPLSWCEENNLSAEGSSKRLNEFLASESRSRHLPWTEDILPIHWRPNPALINPSDAPWLDKELQNIFDLTGIRLGLDPD